MKKAEDLTLSQKVFALPFVGVKIRKSMTSMLNTGRYGRQRIEFEGDPDVPMISKEDFREREFTILH